MENSTMSLLMIQEKARERLEVCISNIMNETCIPDFMLETLLSTILAEVRSRVISQLSGEWETYNNKIKSQCEEEQSSGKQSD